MDDAGKNGEHRKDDTINFDWQWCQFDANVIDYVRVNVCECYTRPCRSQVDLDEDNEECHLIRI